MSWEIMLAWLVRLVHIVSAIAAVGGPFFIRVALMPAANSALDEATHQKLREAIAARWRKVVYTLITLFILTGAYSFFVPTRGVNGQLITARWREFGPEDKQLYHLLFGIKVLSAFVIFILASALAGRSAMFAPIRRNARTSITLLLLLGALVVVCATLMHLLPTHMPAAVTGMP